MQKIYIKYNPYLVKTEVLIGENAPKKNSRLNFGNRRLQEWVDTLLEILVEECSTKNFEIIFHGTVHDYEDIISIAEEAKSKDVTIKFIHKPATEVEDKEAAIQEIFKMIQDGPFEELKRQDVVRAFELASSSDFEVNVVATMSAGKSTLINALLNKKLMPAKQEACTATITEIKDNDTDYFNAIVYDKQEKNIGSYENITYSMMEELNSDHNVSKIRIEGNIPFVSSNDVSLVLVDTPGPNNSRDPKHKAATYRMISESSKPLVLYIMNATQLAVDDDNNLLSYVAESMKVGGKQSRDRFIFVVNKLDTFNMAEDSVVATLNKVRDYLSDNGIENPNIYPTSALTALNIRTILPKNLGDDDEETDETKYKVRKFNRNEEMHFEKYAPLPASVKMKITNRLHETVNKNEQALIHSGIVSIEEAISLYVEKYAKTAKIKNIVDTFIKRIESAHTFETAREQISQNEEQNKSIIERIEAIESKLASGEEAKSFREQIEKLNYDREISNLADEVFTEAQKKITNYLGGSDKKIPRQQAENVCEVFSRFADNLQAEVQVRLEDLILKNVKGNAIELLEVYKKKLSELVNEVSIGDVEIDPFKMMLGELPTDTSRIIEDSSKIEQIKVGEKWEVNTNRKWYKPWTWSQEKGRYIDIIEDEEYIDGMYLAHQFFAPIQETLFENRAKAVIYAKDQAESIKKNFSRKFEELDKVLQNKLQELKLCVTDKKVAEEKLEDSKRKLEWLEDIQYRINKILEI